MQLARKWHTDVYGAFDLGSKSWSFTNVAPNPVKLNRSELLADPYLNPIPRHDSVTVLPFELLDLQLVINRGAVFGIGGPDGRANLDTVRAILAAWVVTLPVAATLAGLSALARGRRAGPQHRSRSEFASPVCRSAVCR